jgi:acyl-coenzyme A synthetase/AMP-(fatty) acid ligase
MSGHPLLRHFELDSVFAYRRGEPVTARHFLQDVHALAIELPDRGHVINVCADRYRFCVGFAAALLRGQLTLLPPNQTQDMLARLQSRFRDVYRLTDTDDGEGALPTMAFPALSAPAGLVVEIPMIPAEQTGTLMFTSGSTGEPVPHAKSWGTLVESGAAEGARLGLTASGTALLGTVPPQHMYGLESTVMMPLQCGLAMHAARPFYPADVCDALEALPRPRALVTTPVHLRTLVSGANAVPHVDVIVCATSPLSPQLAAQAEARFAAPLFEIYGCTEAGQVATRRTVESPEWRALPAIRLREDEEGVRVRGGHVHDEVLLNDVIELRGEERFLLHGRKADLVNVAGKRTSLAHLNFHLNSIEGVRDGVFIVPDEVGGSVARLMAFVVAPGVAREAVLEGLRRRIDPAFMPRPLSFVAALPRNSTGKLPRASLDMLVAEADAGAR